MTKVHAAVAGLARLGGSATCLLLFLATIGGCYDRGEPPPIADVPRPVKTLLVSSDGTDTGIELPGHIRAPAPADLAFNDVGGQILELPIAGREGQAVLKGELLAQIDPETFETALRKAEVDLNEAYSMLDLARAEHERLEKMKGINPDLVSTSMLERTREKLEQAESRLEPMETKVRKAEARLEHSSLRAPFAGIITRCLVEDSQRVKAGEPILSLQDISHLEILVEAPEPEMEAASGPELDGLSAIARFPAAPGEEFSLKLKGTVPAADPATGRYRIVLEMPKPRGIELRPDMTGTVRFSGKGAGLGGPPVLIPAIAVVTDPAAKDFVWVVDEELRAHRREVRVGRLAGWDQIHVLSGLAAGERIVVAGVMRLADGQQVRLWEGQEADSSR